jgi:pimeloyl-ACP methyl ester carboxylesterase
MLRPHLVQIPAFCCDSRLYSKTEAALASHFDISTHVPSADRYPAMADALLAQTPERFVVMGTSMGARLALEVTLAAPNRVQGLIMMGAAAGAVADQPAGLKRSERIRSGAFESVIMEMGQMITHGPGPNSTTTIKTFHIMASDMGAEIAAKQSDALAYRVDRWSELRDISCPTLFLWGQFDQFSPSADAIRMNNSVAGSRLAIIGHCGHFPTLEEPQRVVEIIAKWARDHALLPR